MKDLVRSVLLGSAPIRVSALSWRRPLIIAVVATILTAISIAAGDPQAAIPLAIGAIFSGLGGIGEPIGHRWRIMLWTTLWVALAATLGGLLSNTGVWELMVVAVLGAACGFAGALGPRAALIGIVTLVTFSILAGMPDTELGSFEAGALVGLGGVAQITVAVIPVLVWHRASLSGREVNLASMRTRLRVHFTPRDGFFRHGVRLALAMTVASAIGIILEWPHEYWIPMTVAWLSRPDAHGMATRVLSRVVGTLAGVVLAIALIEGLHFGQPAVPLLVGLGSLVMLVYLTADYTIAVIGITLVVLALFTLIGEPIGASALYRVTSTLVAGVIVLLASTVWPSRRE